MLQIIPATGALLTAELPKSISAQKPKREGGHARAKKRRGGEHVLWKRLLSAYGEHTRKLSDEELKAFTKSNKLVAPLTRLVFFGHLTPTQGTAGRRYADVMRVYERFHIAGAQRSVRAQNVQASRPGHDQEIQRHIVNGTIKEYEREARRARKDYQRMMKVLGRYADPATGRNIAKDVLDDLVLSDIEPPAQWRTNLGAVLTAIAAEFGGKEGR